GGRHGARPAGRAARYRGRGAGKAVRDRRRDTDLPSVRLRPVRHARARRAAHVRVPRAMSAAPEISVVIPCLNEAETVAAVVEKARAGIANTGLAGEVIVVDNGSTDGSAERAAAAGAEIVHEPRRGYGSAYLAGLARARGRYVVLADADDTYDVTRLAELLEPLRKGADLVLGSPFHGRILPGAMPWSHRVRGHPVP